MNTGLKRLEENLNVSENKLAMAISETKIKVSIPFLVRLKDLYFGFMFSSGKWHLPATIIKLPPGNLK